MSTQQQTVLWVQTNKPSPISISGATGMSITGSSVNVIYSGTGTSSDPYVGTFGTGQNYIELTMTGNGTLYYDIRLYEVGIGNNSLYTAVKHSEDLFFKEIYNSFSEFNDDFFVVTNNDKIIFQQNDIVTTGGTFSVFFEPNQQQNVFTVPEYDFLDLYEDIPIKINKSFSELQDISKRNSDYSIGLKLPGSKKNNAFFENFFNVDSSSLYFDATSKVQCQVLLNDESYFTGYLKLNSTSVKNSLVEYDVTLFSNVADLYGKIGNNLLSDLNFRDVDYNFNHVFTRDNTLKWWRYETLKADREVPSNYFYPVIHNGYNYEPTGFTAQVLYTGLTGTSLYTTVKLGSWPTYAAFTAATSGFTEYRINSPLTGIRDNQLKPALNMYSILKLMFKTYGYTIKSDFFTTPWMKLLYMYGYFSDDNAKLTYKVPPPQIYDIGSVEIVLSAFNDVITITVVKKGTGTPTWCSQPITVTLEFFNYSTFGYDYIPVVIPAQQFQLQYTYALGALFWTGIDPSATDVGVSSFPLAYAPISPNTVQQVVENTYLDFSQLINQDIKQIDVLSSIAKKFNLVFVPDPEVPNQIIIEPYQYYVGSGKIYDWTDKLSWNEGFTIQPAQNFVESEIELSDLEDGDFGNKDFKDSNSRIYGRNLVYNTTEFKSQKKDITTTFSPFVFRKWNQNTIPTSTDVGFPLGISYVESSQESTSGNQSLVYWIYKGVKTKPKLMYSMGNFSPFLDDPSEVFGLTGVTTNYFRMMKSDGTSPSGSLISPLVNNSMTIGNPDSNKINNDSICILFNAEESYTIAGDTVTTFDTLTEQDAYNLFYRNKVDNAYDKNTRMLSGFFNLNLSDVKNLTPKDLIKINEQYFSWNKIENYNLTNRELTNVELLQFNNTVSTYPDRYFIYYYCEEPEQLYRFQTLFTGTDSIFDSKFYYSILYDYFVGALGGNVSGFTSSFQYTGNTYLPYSIYEISQQEFDTSTALPYTLDPARFYFIDSLEEQPSSTIYNQDNPIWLINSGQTLARLNAFTGCTAFTTAATALGVLIAGTNPPIGPVYQSGATLNVTDTGWIKYDTPSGTTYRFISRTGTYTITDCALCSTINNGFPYADLANFTITSCGSNC